MDADMSVVVQTGTARFAVCVWSADVRNMERRDQRAGSMANMIIKRG
jgi:2-keto-3-deoxy-galactonokinase